jgi:hypothetical protein
VVCLPVLVNCRPWVAVPNDFQGQVLGQQFSRGRGTMSRRWWNVFKLTKV